MLDSTRNFANVQVAGLHTATDTSIPLVAGEGACLPNPGVGGDTAFNVTWWNATDFPDPSLDPNRERVRVTARATDTLTVIRGQEGIAATTKNLAGKTYRMVISWGVLERDQLREFPLTTRGDIPVFGTTKTRLPVGADGQALLADSTQPLGVRWGTPPAGSIIQTRFVDAPTAWSTHTSHLYADIPQATITLTTGANRLLVTYQGLLSHSLAGNRANFDLLINGVSEGTRLGMGFVMREFFSAAHREISFNFIYITPVMVAGSNTIRLQWANIDAVGQLQMQGGGISRLIVQEII